MDAETDPFEPGVYVAPFIWGLLLDTGEYFEFLSTALLVAWCHAQTTKIILYAHNGGKFDFHFMRDDLESDSLISVVAGRIARAHIGMVELRDSLNLFGQTKLADFSKEEIDYRKMHASVRHLHMPEIKKYLKSDCVNLLTLVTSFIDKFGLQFTQAGAAMRYWQKHYAPKETNERGTLAGVIPKSSERFYDAYAPFYFGGRVQCFASGHAREEFSVADINSAYPRAMLDAHPYATEPLRLSRLVDDVKLPQCLIELDAVSKGALPIRAKDRSLFFPNDEKKIRRYFTTGWELIAGLETNTLQVHKIHKCHYFGTPVHFKDYIEHFFNERANAKIAGDKAMDIFAKIFMNALYGKFGAAPAIRETSIDENGEDVTHERIRYREFCLSAPGTDAYSKWVESGFFDQGEWGARDSPRRMLVRPLPREKHRYYNIATAASITGWVRAFLWRSLQQCEGALYCDTDSIAAKSVERLDKGKKLGQWKLEAQCDEYAIAGKKNYAFHILGKDRPLDIRRQRPLHAVNAQTGQAYTNAEWKSELECWKLASKGADLSPGQMIEAANGGEILHRAQVQNFSIHRSEFSFIDRKVRSTYRDISNLDAYERAA